MEVRTSGGDLDSTTLTNIHYGGHPEKISCFYGHYPHLPKDPSSPYGHCRVFFWECLALTSIEDLDSPKPTEVRLALCERLDEEEDEIPAI